MTLAASLAERLESFPLLTAETPLGRIAYRHAGPSEENKAKNRSGSGSPADSSSQSVSQAPLVLLHGIGSASASWLKQLESLSDQFTVLTWNAPGYTGSAPLPIAAPAAADYAARMWAWLDALGISNITLAGHSLGALMAGAAARIAPARVERLVLLAPAGGYGKADANVRETKLRERLSNLAALGPQGMAEKRGAAMLSPAASADDIAFIKSVMAEIDPAGYTQAVHMLMHGDLAGDLAHLNCPITVASGSADTITPPAACQAVAVAARTPWIDLGAAGHACPLEAATLVNRLLSGGNA